MFKQITKNDILAAIEHGNISCCMKGGDVESVTSEKLCKCLRENLDALWDRQIDLTKEPVCL